MSIRDIDSESCSCKVSDFVYIFRKLVFIELTRAWKFLSINETMLEVVMQILFFRASVSFNQL
nr:MAG TPA: hypothetical protein [Bacteriophage sp.]